ncbi:MAG: PqqD family protein [Myxococcales bacterium]|nr:PqqD family protein [Myxococcales bacterium]
MAQPTEPSADAPPDDQPLRVPPDVLSRMLDGEAVILDLTSGTYFGLDAVGSRIWELIQAGATPRQIRTTLCEEFEVDDATVAQDLAKLVATLRAKGLLA